MRSDLELIQSILSGDRQLFAELVTRYQRNLLRLILRMTQETSVAEDVVQESFLKAYQKLAMFEGRSSFKSWLYQIAINTARNKLRMRTFDSLNWDDARLGTVSGADRRMVADTIRDRIQIEIDQLPERQQMALRLRIYEDLSFKEIAEIMDCPYDTAKANYRHALLKLREEFAGEPELSAWFDSNDSGFSMNGAHAFVGSEFEQ